MFGWFRKRRRERILAEPFPEVWLEYLQANVGIYGFLNVEQQQRVQRFIQVVVAEKNWEGCQGVKITDEIKVTIAGLAGLLVLRDADEFFERVLSILVYPSTYLAGVNRDTSGTYLEAKQARLGEAWYNGPVVLAWDDVLAGGRFETLGHNLVLHEFAHQLDMLNGRDVDGQPPLPTDDLAGRWQKTMLPAYRALVQQCQHGRGFIDCYGTTNPAEFFAVVTEAFFDGRTGLRENHPDLYELLRDYYEVDPAGWEIARG